MSAEMSTERTSPQPSSATLDQANAETMQIFVRNAAGQETTLNVSPNTTIATLKSLISFTNEPAVPQDASSVDRPSSPSAMAKSTELRLVFAGRQLDNPESTLKDYNIPGSSTLHLALPSTADATIAEEAKATASTSATEAPMATAKTETKPKSSTSTPSKSSNSKKPRCTLKSCNAFAQRVVGDCGFCGGHFCGKHRLLESHACSGLEDCKDEARERNRERLETERTIAVRGV